MVNFTIC